MQDLRRIDLNLLVALHALIEEGSVTRAANRLALTQPTVSAMLVRLRKLLGDPLFVRTQRGMLPTPRTRELAPALSRWIGEASNLIARQSFDPATTPLTATIAANDYIQSALLVPFLRSLRQAAPPARIAIRNPIAGDVAAALASGELDICITTSGEQPPANLPSRLLYDERYVGVVRKAHPLRSKRVSLDQFCRYPHVMVSPTDGGFVGPTDLALQRRGRHRTVQLSMPSFLTLPEILKGDDLIAIVPRRLLCNGRASGLRTFTLPVDVPGFSVLALWHPRQQNDPAHQWLRELIAATAKSLVASNAPA